MNEPKRGPGQPPKPIGIKRVPQTFCIAPSTLAKLKAHRARTGLSMGFILDKLVDGLPNPRKARAAPSEISPAGMGNLPLSEIGDAGVHGINDGKARAIVLEGFVGAARKAIEEFTGAPYVHPLD